MGGLLGLAQTWGARLTGLPFGWRRAATWPRADLGKEERVAVPWSWRKPQARRQRGLSRKTGLVPQACPAVLPLSRKPLPQMGRLGPLFSPCPAEIGASVPQIRACPANGKSGTSAQAFAIRASVPRLRRQKA